MKLPAILLLLIFLSIFYAYQDCHAKRKNYYRTFEIIGISDNVMTLKDNDGNVIAIDRDPEEYKVGYKVRYDSVRKRLRTYRWQDYKVSAISENSVTLEHHTGDTVFLNGNYLKQYNIGDSVRYDSVDNKLQADEDSTQWQQYTVVAAASDQITIRSNLGEDFILHMDNNVYPERRGVYIPQYKVGDMVRYDKKNNKLKKKVRRTYDWQEYVIKESTDKKLTLANEDNEELILENVYGTKFNAGDQVKYDRLNNLLKKLR